MTSNLLLLDALLDVVLHSINLPCPHQMSLCHTLYVFACHSLCICLSLTMYLPVAYQLFRGVHPVLSPKTFSYVQNSDRFKTIVAHAKTLSFVNQVTHTHTYIHTYILKHTHNIYIYIYIYIYVMYPPYKM